MFKGCLPLCHWARLQWFILSQRCAVHTELISVCMRDLTVLYSPHTCGLALHHMHCEPFVWGSISSVMPVQRTHWQCHGCVGYIYDLCLASCLPHVLYFCAVEASHAEQTLPLPLDLHPCFQKTTDLAELCHWWVNDWSRKFTQNSLQKCMCCQNTWSCQVCLKEHTALKMQKDMFYDIYNT